MFWDGFVMSTRINQFLSLNLMFLCLLDLLLHFQDLPSQRQCRSCRFGGLLWGAVTVALGATSMTNFFCWRSLMVSFMATGGRGSGEQPTAGERVDTRTGALLIDAGGRQLLRHKQTWMQASRAALGGRVAARWHVEQFEPPPVA
jgi:hypothetical protein